MKPRSFLLPTLVAFVLALAPATAQAATTLQPGAYHETDAGSCPLNFAYSGNGKTYLGTAAHCVEQIGQPVRDIEGTEFGSVALTGHRYAAQGGLALIPADPPDAGT